jgi:adenine/guanine phosphoribosyltransferase-like PRPP-binding protein/8-oxo-dGTP pyrophosphatase MutT (NUDIX family)
MTKHKAHALGLPHPVVHVLIFKRNGFGERVVLAQRRDEEKELMPGLWDISVGGHVSAGENPYEAGLRECREEVGLLPEHILEFDRHGMMAYGKAYCVSAGSHRQVVYLYGVWVVPEWEPTFEDGEVMDSAWVLPHVMFEGLTRGEDGEELEPHRQKRWVMTENGECCVPGSEKLNTYTSILYRALLDEPGVHVSWPTMPSWAHIIHKKGVPFLNWDGLWSASSRHIESILFEWERQLESKRPAFVVAMESRGYLLAPLLAARWDVPLLRVTKKGKLAVPEEDLVRVEYYKEYSAAEGGAPEVCEVAILKPDNPLRHQDGLLVDDVMATWGTGYAAWKACREAGITCSSVVVLARALACRDVGEHAMGPLMRVKALFNIPAST